MERDARDAAREVAVPTRTGPRTVAGDGFEIEEHFPQYLDYREGGRTFRVSAEMSTAPGTSILLFHDADDAHWQPPHRAEPLDAATVRTILVRVTAAMHVLGIHLDWQALPLEADRDDWAAIATDARALLSAPRGVRNDTRDLLVRAYAAFNARDIDAVLAVMHPDVDWSNGMEGGRVHGHAAARDYWTRQWRVIDPQVIPIRFSDDESGRIVVDARQIVRDLNGQVQTDRMVQHVYVLRDALIASMEIVELS